MGLKPGYKRTDVGVIPEDWNVSTVGREFEIKLGKMLDAEKNVGVPKPYIGNKAVQWDRIDISDLPTVPMSRTDIERFRLRKGDLLVCEGGEVGRAAIWEAPIEECYYQKALHRLRPLRGFDSRLMVALLRQWSDRGLLANYVTQTSIAHLPREKFVEVQMPIPTPAEQRAIAEALSDVDALIGALDQLITKKRDLKQAAMQQLLTGKPRLPGFRGEWEVKRLDELGAWKGRMTPSMQNPSYWHDGNVPWISSGDVKSVLLKETGFSVTASAVKQGTTTLLPANSIVVVTRSGILRKYLPVAMNVIPMAINQDIKALIPNEKFCSTYLLHALIGNGDRILARCLKAGTTVESIEFRWLKAFTIPLPPLPEQTAIAEVLSDMDAELAALEQRRDKTRALKQGMMQELLTGRTRLV